LPLDQSKTLRKYIVFLFDSFIVFCLFVFLFRKYYYCYVCALVTGADNKTIWKLWFHKIKLSNLYKIGKFGEEIGKIINKIGTFTVSIDTASAPIKL